MVSIFLLKISFFKNLPSRVPSAKNSPWLIPILTSLTMLLAFFIAPYFPKLELLLKPYAKYNLGMLLLINSLHINYSSLSTVLLQKPLLLIYGILVKNILLPLAVFIICYLFWPEMILPGVLLAGISSGFSAAAFAILLRLSPEPNLLLTLGSSFVVPFSLPYLLHLLAGSRIEINTIGMMLQTAWMIFVPILIERILFISRPTWHSRLKSYSQILVALNLSSTAFILMLSGQKVLRLQALDFWYNLIFVLLIIILLYMFSLLFFYRANPKTQMVILISSLVSNSGMASVLALDYLDNKTLAITIIFGILWNFNVLFLRSWVPFRKLLVKWAGLRGGLFKG